MKNPIFFYILNLFYVSCKAETHCTNSTFGFKDQIQRATISISNNIAEGFDRMSDKEFVRFLYIAQASCSEVKSMLYLANRLNYLDKKITKLFVENTNEIGRIIRGLKKSLTTNFN